MTRLEARAILAADRAQRRALTRLAAALTADLPDLHVAIDGDRVTVTGRGVLDDPRLVWIGSVLR
ncbi:MAG: hypothetical protein JSR79_07145 [Proteobacteria bacterium]|nr:hypothetical protein [Pseudomonadota bacterium]